MKTKKRNEELLVLTDVIKVLVSNTRKENHYAIFEERVPPLGGPPPHRHPDEEIFCIIEGKFEFILNDMENPFQVLPGSVVHIPSNAIHTFKNVGGTPGKMVVLLKPGNLLDYFRAIGTPIRNKKDRPDLTQVPDLSKIDLTKVFELAPQYNIEFFLPEVMKKDVN
ncbi:MAG TPA: cupin domain-containing protein [Mariniphaga sp.]|nr:cupin domain-containing protein [Mariniphaga sp.]